jgi:TatD DNase family protein
VLYHGGRFEATLRRVRPLLDSHCHLDDPRFADDVGAVLERARAAAVQGFVVAGYGPERWPAQAALAVAHPDVVVTFGLHPWLVAGDAPDTPLAPWLEKLARALDGGLGVRPVALGELGLDRGPRVEAGALERQREALRAQLAMARERDLPVVLHVVRAHGQVLEVLRSDGLPDAGGMVHGFTGAPEVAAEYVALGLFVSFGGAVTRPRAKKARRAAAEVPAERLLLETDSPDQPPHERAGARNEPAFLVDIAAAVAHLRGQPAQQVAEGAAANARRLFRL